MLFRSDAEEVPDEGDVFTAPLRTSTLQPPAEQKDFKNWFRGLTTPQKIQVSDMVGPEYEPTDVSKLSFTNMQQWIRSLEEKVYKGDVEDDVRANTQQAPRLTRRRKD